MIKRDGGEALFVQTDVREASEVKNLVAAAVKTYGGLHCAFNNAGVLPQEVCSPTLKKRRSIKLSPSI